MNRPTCQRNGPRVIRALRRETTNAGHNQEHQAPGTSLLARRARMVRRRSLRALSPLFRRARRRMPPTHRARVLRAATQSALLSAEPLLLNRYSELELPSLHLNVTAGVSFPPINPI